MEKYYSSDIHLDCKAGETKLEQLAEKIGLPDDSRSVLRQTLDELLRQHASDLTSLCDEYLSDGDFSFDKLDSLAEKHHIHPYTASLAFLLYCVPKLKKRYESSELSDELFVDTMKDLKYKNDECMAVKGMTGTFVREWFRLFYQLGRFSLGRFQYEKIRYDRAPVTLNGLTVSPGDNIINIHIPYSGVPITSDIRLDSYKKAYEFYKNGFDGKAIPFICHSWLLYNKEGFFPQKSNIYAFQNEFHIIEAAENDNKDVWRLFLTDTKDYSTLPEISSLHRHLKQWLMNGKRFGEGLGIFFFDGEQIIGSDNTNKFK